MDANTENNSLLLACTSGDIETIDEIFQSFNEEFYHLHNNYLSEELFHKALGTTLLAGNAELSNELDVFEILIEAGFGSQFLFYLNQ